MKDKIKQAGFKSHVEFARHYEVRQETVFRWCKEPPRRVVQYLNSIIRCNVLEKENMKLLSDLNTIRQWMHPNCTLTMGGELKPGEQRAF